MNRTARHIIIAFTAGMSAQKRDRVGRIASLAVLVILIAALLLYAIATETMEASRRGYIATPPCWKAVKREMPCPAPFI